MISKEDLEKAIETVKKDTSLDQDTIDFIEHSCNQMISLKEGYERSKRRKQRIHDFLMNECDNRWAVKKKYYSYYNRKGKVTHSTRVAIEVEENIRGEKLNFDEE